MAEALKKPKITVLMPVYNGQRYLRNAIQSILDQTYIDFELLIMNDGSTDESEAIIKSFNDTRIRLENNPGNLGIVDTLNKGIELANGEYVARMDCDDISSPDRFKRQVEILETNNNIAVVATHIVLINEKDEEIGYWPEEMQTKTNEQIQKTILNDNCIAHPSIMIRIATLKQYRYKRNQKGSEDWDLWMRMTARGEGFAKINRVLLRYRIHQSSITGQRGRGNVYPVKMTVQIKYLLNGLKAFHFNKVDFKVMGYLFGNTLKYCLTSIYPASLNVIKQITTTNVFKAYGQYAVLKRYCKSKEARANRTFFFFPYYHTGGAEKVHASIVEAVSDQKPVVFFTNISKGDALIEEFKRNAKVIDIGLIAYYPFFNKSVKKLIGGLISNLESSVTFGCNSQLYYYLLPHLSSNVKCIDLIHAFVHKDEQGPEKWSLPVVERIDRRVVIIKKAIEDFKELYLNHNKSLELINRIECISNFVDVPAQMYKEEHEKFTVIYVGRNSPEKRVYLAGNLAHRLNEEAGMKFNFIGDLESGINLEDKEYCNFFGEIKDIKALEKYYRQTDVLLLTSTREGFPMVIMEAMANGVGVVTTSVGGIKEHISNGITGILVEETEEEDIVTRMAEILVELSGNKEKLNSITREAYLYAKNNFDKSRFVNAYRSIIVNNNNVNG